MMFLVPNHVHDAIHEAIDKKLEGRPMEAEERQSIYKLRGYGLVRSVLEYQLSQIEGK